MSNQQSDYLECGFVEPDESYTVYVHRKDGDLLVFKGVKTDPVFYKGWFCIDHTWTGVYTLSSQVRADEVSYISHRVEEQPTNG